MMIEDKVQQCEEALLRHKSVCLEYKAFKSWPRHVDRIIERRLELQDAWSDLYDTLTGDHGQIYVFMDAILCGVTGWGLENVAEDRSLKKTIIETNDKVARTAGQLFELLEKLDNLEKRGAYGVARHYHIIDTIEKAASQNCLFNAWVKEPLGSIRSKFDLKYWPSINQVIREIADNAANAKHDWMDDVTSVAHQSKKISRRSSGRAIIRRVLDECEPSSGRLPEGFHLKDSSWASVLNVLLDLPGSELFDSEAIKAMRNTDLAQKSRN